MENVKFQLGGDKNRTLPRFLEGDINRRNDLYQNGESAFKSRGDKPRFRIRRGRVVKDVIGNGPESPPLRPSLEHPDRTEVAKTEIKECKERSAIILIGPRGAGKSTIAAHLSEQLQIPRYPLDELRFEYYKEIGYQKDTAAQIREQEGFHGLYQYWKPFEIHALERVLSDYPSNCVIDLGAGHSVYEDDAYFRRAQQALASFKNVILLLPSPDKADSLQILRERTRERSGEATSLEAFDAHCLHHHSNYDLATGIVYTKGMAPEETGDLVLLQVKR